jgi:hypothetical protein
MKSVGILLDATKDWCLSDASENAEGRREQQEPKCVKAHTCSLRFYLHCLTLCWYTPLPLCCIWLTVMNIRLMGSHSCGYLDTGIYFYLFLFYVTPPPLYNGSYGAPTSPTTYCTVGSSKSFNNYVGNGITNTPMPKSTKSPSSNKHEMPRGVNQFRKVSTNKQS